MEREITDNEIDRADGDICHVMLGRRFGIGELELSITFLDGQFKGKTVIADRRFE